MDSYNVTSGWRQCLGDGAHPAQPPRVTRAVCITVARPAVHARYVVPDRTLFAVRTAYMGTTANDLWWSRRGLLSRVDCPPSNLCTGTFLKLIKHESRPWRCQWMKVRMPTPLGHTSTMASIGASNLALHIARNPLPPFNRSTCSRIACRAALCADACRP